MSYIYRLALITLIACKVLDFPYEVVILGGVICLLIDWLVAD